MYKVLIVEDDAGIAGGLKQLLEAWGLQPVVAENLQDVLGCFARVSPHLVVMDISLPYFDGYYWCQQIRRLSHVPILFLSSAGDTLNQVMAMNMGADDFVAKPFDEQVFVAKVQALLRRTYDFGGSMPVLYHRGLALNTADGTASYNSQKIPLTKNEYRILLCLMQNKGQVVSREKLMQQLWESDSFVDENTLSVNVNRLRKKLAEAGLNSFIATKFGVGYMLQEEEE